MYDYVVIGSGIIGSLITRELSKYAVKVLVIDKENDIASHQTTANSAIIHSGHDPKVGSLKAKFCVLGNKLYDDLEKELNIPLLRTGALVVANGKKEETALDELYQRALKNEVPEVSIISGEEARTLDPLLSKDITKALSLPTTKVTYPWEVAISAIGNAIKNGASFKRNAHVISIEKNSTHYVLHLKDGSTIASKNIINAAGVNSDVIASYLEEPEFKITPRKGEYYVLDRKAVGLFHQVIYPLPTDAGKGVLIVPQVHGNVLLGPTSTLVEDKECYSNTKEGFSYIKQHLKRLSKEIPFDMIIRTFAGVRATSTYEDFYIKESKLHKGFYHVAGIDSPGLTAAPAIANYVVHELLNIQAPLKTAFDPIFQKPKPFHSLPFETQQKLVRENPKYGNLICKCEKITEQEIIDAIHGPTGNDTIKGIKKRARAGAGLCQGGYCEGLVLKIIARETNKPLTEINYYASDTPILVKETKTNEKN
ncbi:MAG: NAD(P)/FAD-dependent oxidoreductase [Acholeplasma sp.]|nr:NAD(P)/FAD-dependent oxidoreductase [Acholeplasma sp.]